MLYFNYHIQSLSGYIWMCMDVDMCNGVQWRQKEVSWARGAQTGMICGHGWPGNFPTHHVLTRTTKKIEKRATTTQSMNQGPHNACTQPNQKQKWINNNTKLAQSIKIDTLSFFSKKHGSISELKNSFANFLGVLTLRCRYALLLHCIRAECSRNMGP